MSIRRLGPTLAGLALLALTSGGCGSPGAFAPGLSTPSGSPTPTPTPTSGANTLSGTITLQGHATAPTIRLFQNTAVGIAPTLVASVTPGAGGSYAFPHLADGSYTVAITGSGLRPQSDNLSLTGGQTITGNYTVTALADLPSDTEAEGFAAAAAHLTRSFYGIRAAVPIANQVFAQNIRQTQRPRFSPTTFSTTSIALTGAVADAIDTLGHAWVATEAGVSVLSNAGTLLASLPTGGTGANLVAVDASNDVLVNNASGTLALFPHLSSTADLENAPFSHQVLGLSAQNANVTVDGTVFAGPHLAGLNGSGIFFVGSDGTTVQPNGPPGDGNVRLPTSGFTVHATDNTPWVGIQELFSDQPPDVPGVVQVAQDGSELLTQINLVSLAGLNDGDVVTALAFDTNGNLFVASNSAAHPLVKISTPQTGATVSASLTGSIFPNGVSSLAVDSSNNVWATATGGTTAVQFDNTLSNPISTSVGASPTSVAVDANGNAFVVSSTGVTRIAVNGPVPLPNGNATLTLADGSTVTVTVANGVTTITETFPQGPQDVSVVSGNTVSNGNTSATVQGTSAYGPTTSTLTITENSSTGVITYTSQSTSSFDGVQMTTTATVQPDGSETVAGSASNGETFNLSYGVPGAGGTSMTGTYTNSTTGDTVDVSATFANDGSLSVFSIDDTARGITATGTLSPQAAWSANITQDGTGTPLASVSDPLLQDVLVQFLDGSNPSAIDNFQTFGVTTTGGNNVYENGISGTFSDSGTFTLTGAQFNDTAPSFTSGQGDGNTDDSGTGQGSYTAFDGAGGSGGSVRESH